MITSERVVRNCGVRKGLRDFDFLVTGELPHFEYLVVSPASELILVDLNRKVCTGSLQ